MAESGLTRDQQVQLDLICKIQPDEVVASMSRHELKIYRELLTARDQAEEGFRAQNVALPPKAVATALAEEEPIPEDLKPPAPTAPTAEPAKKEVPTPPEPKADTVDETDIPSTVYDPEEMARWEQRLSEIQDRYKHAQAALTPAQQAAASLRKKTKSMEQGLDQVREEMDQRFARLEQLILEFRQAPAPATQDPDPLEGLAELDPDLDRRLRAMMARLESKVQQPLKQIQDDFTRREQEAEEARRAAFVAQHDAAVRQMVPDFDALIQDGEIKNWLGKQAPAIQRILAHPYDHTPHDVAYAFAQFRATKKNGAPRKPSLGDIAASVKLSGPTSLNEQAPAQEILTDEQFANIETLMRTTKSSGGDLDALMAKYERTFLAKQKPR